MATTIDHLRVDHRVTVLCDFTDAAGTTMRTGETGVLRRLNFDQVRMEIQIEIERSSGNASLVFPLAAKTGPRNGHMREYFAMGADVSTPRSPPGFRRRDERKATAPPPMEPAGPMNTSAWHLAAQSTEGPDRLEAMEEEMRKAIDHIGVAASIAEVYAQRMRAFRRAGNETRAIAAFKLAVDWMRTYAGWATSGGEGTALSRESKEFHAALVREFGYDPAKGEP